MDDEATNHFIKAVKTININTKVKDKKKEIHHLHAKKKKKNLKAKTNKDGQKLLIHSDQVVDTH